MNEHYQELISAIKARADCRSIFKRFWPGKYRERGNSLCPFHEDREPSMQVTKELAYCHAEALSLDAIDLYERGAACTRGEAIRLLAVEMGLESPAHADLPPRRQAALDSSYFSRRMGEALKTEFPHESIQYLHRRGISDETIRKLREQKLIGWDTKLSGIAFPLSDWSGEKIIGIQVIPIDGSKKRFVKGSQSKHAFFRFGTGSELAVFCEGIIDSISITEALPAAQGIALLGAGLINKLSEIEVPSTSLLFLDNDDAGKDATARIVHKFGAVFRLVDWALAPEGMKDVNDLLMAGHSPVIDSMIRGARPPSKDDLARIASRYGSRKNRERNQSQPGAPEEENGKKQTQAQQLVLLAEDVEFFHTADDTIYATFALDGHRETWPVRCRSFRRWLARRFYESHEKPPGNQALQDALNIMEARGQFEGEQREVFVRIAQARGNIYIDLANEPWEAIEITSSGWSITAEPPVKFRRTRGMLPLVYPEPGGSLNDLKCLLNLPDDTTLKLVIGWIVQTGHPTGPYPILNLEGEQGAGKSITAKIMRSILDPSTAPIRTIPREERDLLISANNTWIVAFDNLSGVPLWLSDALCRLSTGGGYAIRELYSNDEETIFNATRPLLLTGIDQIAARHDLADRSIIVRLQAIADEKRISEKKIMERFQDAHPKLLGALCDALSAAIGNLAQVHLRSLPRMADFALWVSAAEPALPWKEGEFLDAYTGNRKEAVEQSLESDAVSSAVRELMASRNEWEGTSSELLDKLCEITPEKLQKSKAWPKAPNALSNRLRRSATFLRAAGIEVEFVRLLRSGKRTILLRSTAIPASCENQEKAHPSDQPIDSNGQDWEEI